MKRLLLVFGLLSAQLQAQNTTQTASSARGPYCRIAILRPHEGDTVDFESGYIRHLEWHRQAKDSWSWYGWTIWAGDRQRWFVYATFGHSASDLDHPVTPSEDERDTLLNVIPHAEFVGSGLYEFLPALSKGSGEPQPAARLEMTTIELQPGTAKAFESALAAKAAPFEGEALWYRMVAGGAVPRYLRLRPLANLSALLEGPVDQTPVEASRLVSKMTVEILNLRPTMCYGIVPASTASR
jgi:hypothetical protein